MARTFPGTSSNFLAKTSPVGALDISGDTITVSAWVRIPSTPSSSGRMVAQWDGLTGWVLSMTNGGKPAMSIDAVAGGAVSVFCATAMSNNVWYHVVGRKNGNGSNSLTIFLNGVLDGTATSSLAIPSNNHDFKLGNRDNANEPFNGTLAEVAVWDIALSDAEIAALAKGVSPFLVHPAHVAGYFAGWGVGDSGEPDLSGVGNQLSETGTVTVVNHAPVGCPFPLAA